MNANNWNSMDVIWKKILNFHIFRPTHNYLDFSTPDFNREVVKFLADFGIDEIPEDEAYLDLLNIKLVNASNFGLDNLFPLKYLPMIEIIDFQNNKISDISLLYLNTNLKNINLYNNKYIIYNH